MTFRNKYTGARAPRPVPGSAVHFTLPYEHRGLAKAAGMHWDPIAKHWYADNPLAAQSIDQLIATRGLDWHRVAAPAAASQAVPVATAVVHTVPHPEPIDPSPGPDSGDLESLTPALCALSTEPYEYVVVRFTGEGLPYYSCLSVMWSVVESGFEHPQAALRATVRWACGDLFTDPRHLQLYAVARCQLGRPECLIAVFDPNLMEWDSVC